MKKRASFKEQLRRSLMIHVLLPCLFFIFILLLSFLYLIFGVVSGNNKEVGKNAANTFQKVFYGYREDLNTFTEDLDFSRFMKEKAYRSEKIGEVYQVLNANEARADFYIFDKKKTLLFSTQTNQMIQKSVENHINSSYSGMAAERRSFLYFYGIWDFNFAPISAYGILEVLPDTFGEMESLCAFVLDLHHLKKMTAFENAGITIVNKFGRILFENGFSVSDERGKIEEKFKNKTGLLYQKGSYLFVSKTETEIEGIVIYSFDDCTLYVNLAFTLILVSLFLLLLVTVVMIRSARKFSDKKTVLIYKLVDGLKQVEGGDLSVRLTFDTEDEFEDIGNGFNMMIESIGDLLKRHEALTRENIQATVVALESQFNPHFLFNTLESVKYMIRQDPNGASKMLVNLSKLLRYSIRNESEFVPLGEELDFLDRYIQIMYLRYGEKLEYQFEMKEDLRAFSVPKMILQPIVENSIKYGFGEEKINLSISLKIKKEEGRLCFEIFDDGVGIEKELLEKLRKNLEKNYNSSVHIGIYNVNKRIQLLYGKEYGLNIESKAGEGTEVILCLPIQEEGEGNA